ncbi:hypothetical protein Anas_14762, partial [Armadillidium nasatum]
VFKHTFCLPKTCTVYSNYLPNPCTEPFRVILFQKKEKMAPSPVKLKDQQIKDFAESSLQKVKDSMKEGGEPVIFEGKNMNGFLRNNVASLFPTSLFQSVGGIEWNVQALHFTSEEEKCKYLDTSWEEEFSNQVGCLFCFLNLEVDS